MQNCCTEFGFLSGSGRLFGWFTGGNLGRFRPRTRETRKMSAGICLPREQRPLRVQKLDELRLIRVQTPRFFGTLDVGSHRMKTPPELARRNFQPIDQLPRLTI